MFLSAKLATPFPLAILLELHSQKVLLYFWYEECLEECNCLEHPRPAEP